MKRILAIVAVTLALSGCGTFDPTGRSVLQGGTSLTATIDNPVTREQQAKIEVSYQLAADGVLAYSDLRRCAVGQNFTLQVPCSEWTVVQKFKSANRLAYKALQRMRGFADNNQLISATTAYNEVIAAIKSIEETAFINGIK